MRFAKSLLILALVLTSAGSVAAQSARHFTRPREAVDAMVAAVAARDADAMAGLYADDGIILGPNQPLIGGRQAIRDAWLRNFAGGYSALTILQLRTEVGTDRAASVMVWEATIAPPGQAVQTVRGRSILYAMRQPEGWIISADMWQPAP